MDRGYDARGVVTALNSDFMTYFLRGIMLLVLAVFVFGGYAMLQFHGLHKPQAMSMSDTARNLAAGHGFVTKSATPFDVWYLQQKSKPVGEYIPDLHHAPGYPLLLSVAMRLAKPQWNTSDNGIFDAEYKVVVPLNMLLTLLGGAVLFFVGRQLFGNGIAGLATVIYLVSNLTLSAMISGLPLPLLTLLITAGFGFCLLAVHRSTVGEHYILVPLLLIAAALCIGAAVLTDYAMLLVAPVALILLATQLQRLRIIGSLLFILVCLAVTVPWGLHNHKLNLGVLRAAPYDALHDTSLYEGASLDRTVDPHFNPYRVSAAVKRKLLKTFSAGLSGRKAVAGGIVVCFFVLALFHRFEKFNVTFLKWSVLGSMGLLVPAAALFPGAYSPSAALFPLVVLLGTAAFIDYIDREELFDRSLYAVMIWALVLISALPAVGSLLSGPQPSYPPYYAPMQRFVSGMLKPGEFLYTDIPWATAWYGNVPSLLLPQTSDDFAKTGLGSLTPGGIYLTSRTYAMDGGTRSDWPLLFSGRQLEGIPFLDAIELPPQRADQIFVTDSPRWQ